MPPKQATTPSKASISSSPAKSSASPTSPSSTKFNLVLAVKQIFVFKEAIKQAKESGIFTDKEQKKVNEKNAKVAEMKRTLAKELGIVTSTRKGKLTPLVVEGEEELATLEDFFEALIIDTDIVPGNVELCKAMMTCIALDYKTLCQQRGLVVAAIQDGSQQYLTEFLTFSSPRLELDPTELFPAAFFNQQFRIPLTALLLKYESNMDMAAAASDLVAQWNEFIADIAAKKRAIAREDRNGRMALLQTLMTHAHVKYNCDAEGGDGHTVFSRAVSEADTQLLEMMQKHNLCPNINRINGDGRTALMHAVIANNLEVVRFLLKFETIDVYVMAKASGEGTAIDLAKMLRRDMSIVTALGGAMKRQPPPVAVAAQDESFCSMTSHSPLARQQSIAKPKELKLDLGDDSNSPSPTRKRSIRVMLPDPQRGSGDDSAFGSGTRLPLLQKLLSIRAKDGGGGPSPPHQPNSGRNKNLAWVDEIAGTLSHRGSAVFTAMTARSGSIASGDLLGLPKPGPGQKLLNEMKFNVSTGAFEATARVVDKPGQPPPTKPGQKSPRVNNFSSGSPQAAKMNDGDSVSPSAPRQPPTGRPPAHIAPLSEAAPRNLSPQTSLLEMLPSLNSNDGNTPRGATTTTTTNSAAIARHSAVPALQAPTIAARSSPSGGPVNVMELVSSLIRARSIITHRASVGIVSEFEEEKQEQRVTHVGKDYAAAAEKICASYTTSNIYVPPEDDDYLKLQEFLSQLIGEGDSDPGKLKLVEALISRCDLDISIVSDMNALVATAAGDGSVGYLNALLAHPDVKFDPAEAITNGMFNPTVRIPTVLTLLRYPSRMEFARLKLDKQFVGAWHEFFADVACRRRANPNEERTGRMELLELMLGNSVIPADPNHVDSDQLDVFCRAAHDGDVELLELLVKMKQFPNINKVYGDGTTVLIHAVFSNDSKTVEFVLGMPKIDPNIETENGTALAIAIGLNRPKTLVNLLVNKGATQGLTASRILLVPDLAPTMRNKTARSLWDEAMDSNDENEDTSS